MAERISENANRRQVARLLAVGMGVGGLMLGAACSGDTSTDTSRPDAPTTTSFEPRPEDAGPRTSAEVVGGEVNTHMDAINALARQGNTAKRQVVAPAMEEHPRSFSVVVTDTEKQTKAEAVYAETARPSQPGRYATDDLETLILHQRTTSGNSRSVAFAREPGGYSVSVSGFQEQRIYYALDAESAERITPSAAQTHMTDTSFAHVRAYAAELLGAMGTAR